MDFTELVGKGPHDLEMVITQVDPVYECLYEEFLEFDAIPIASVFPDLPCSVWQHTLQGLRCEVV